MNSTADTIIFFLFLALALFLCIYNISFSEMKKKVEKKIFNAFQATVSNLILFAIFFKLFPRAGTISTYCVQTNTGTAYIYLNMQLSKAE